MVADTIARFRPKLLRFATLQLRDTAAAEDAVQEALIAALEGAKQFREEAALQTWVFAILRNKIIDALRRRNREMPVSALLTDAEDEAGAGDSLFDARGMWNLEDRPADWGSPESVMERSGFWKVFDACLENLPERTARVFMMREFLGLDTDEICKELAISTSNCWVILHRARMNLRLCLEARGLGLE